MNVGEKHNPDVFFIHPIELEELRNHVSPIQRQRQKTLLSSAHTRVCTSEKRSPLRLMKSTSKHLLKVYWLVLPCLGRRRWGRKLFTAMGSANTKELSRLGARRVAINISGRFWTRSKRNLQKQSYLSATCHPSNKIMYLRGKLTWRIHSSPPHFSGLNSSENSWYLRSHFYKR